MNNVASLELCKELYELSGWANTKEQYLTDFYRNRDGDIIAPKYDLGYLLRKLRGLRPRIHEVIDKVKYHNKVDYIEYDCYAYTHNDVFSAHADTPENAACKLAIELFKQGILKPAGEGA